LAHSGVFLRLRFTEILHIFGPKVAENKVKKISASLLFSLFAEKFHFSPK
jgi:hypothetical protein